MSCASCARPRLRLRFQALDASSSTTGTGILVNLCAASGLVANAGSRMPALGSVLALDVLGADVQVAALTGRVVRRTSEQFVLAFDRPCDELLARLRSRNRSESSPPHPRRFAAPRRALQWK